NVYQVYFAMHISTIAFVDLRIRQELSRISNALNGQLRLPKRTLFRTTSQFQHLNESKELRKKHEHFLLRSRDLMEIYEQYFPLRIFNVCTIDCKFLFALTMFIANYVVLVMQTSI